MIEKATYVTLFVSDQDRALDFYTNTLGFEKRGDNPQPNGVRFITVGVKGQDLQLVLWPGTRGSSKPSTGNIPPHAIFETNNCNSDFETLKARGVQFEAPKPIEQPYGIFATFVDPDGNRIGIREQKYPPKPN